MFLTFPIHKFKETINLKTKIMAKGNGAFKLMAGLLIGAAAGAAAGLLLAPQSGKETRKQLKREADKLKGELEEKLTEVKSKLQKTADNWKHGAHTTKDEFHENVGV